MNNRARIKLLWLTTVERPEMGGPCWLLKLRWMGTQRVQMKGVLPWAHCAGTRDFILPWLLCSAQYRIFFPLRTLFKFMCPSRQATWAGSHAWPPVSECVSSMVNLQKVSNPRSRYQRYVFLYCENWNTEINFLIDMFLQYFQKIWGFGFLHAGQWRLCEIFPTWLIFFKEIKIVRDTVYIHI